jgi:hypothetical protein
MGSAPAITTDQISALLDQMTANASVTYDQSNHDSVFNSYKTTAPGGATLEVIASPGSMDSRVTASMVFDMYKLQSADSSTNSIRAVQAATDDQAPPMLALYLYPAGTDTMAAQNFCAGK